MKYERVSKRYSIYKRNMNVFQRDIPYTNEI